MLQSTEKVDIRSLNPLCLALVGDSVLELLVRQRLVEYTNLSAGKINNIKVKYVSARAQFREAMLLELYLTPQELDCFKRGRNASKATVAKHATMAEYRASTGLECLLGWLQLKGETARIEELFEIIWTQFDPNV
ncbi:MAG: ribonuclease III domain-containing protein [Faecalibacterium sp.]